MRCLVVRALDVSSASMPVCWVPLPKEATDGVICVDSKLTIKKQTKKNKNIKIINELWYAVCVVVTVTCKEYSRVVLPQHFWMNAIGSWGTAGSSQQGRRRGPTGWSAHECLQALCLYVFFFLYFFINSFPDGFVEWWDGFGVDMPYCRFVLESGIFSTLAHA